MRHLAGLVLLFAWAAAHGQSTLSASPANVQPGGNNVTASWSAIAAPTSTDWIGVYSPGSPDASYWTWRYTTGTASGSVPVTLVLPTGPSLPIGTYELRLYANNGYTRLATSNTFTISGGTLSASPGLATPGGSVSASWSEIVTPSATDWIGLYTPSGTATDYISWQYTNGAASGAAPFAIPASLGFGTYQLRLFKNNSYTHLATSNNIVVGPSISGVSTLNGSPLASVAFAATNGGTCTSSNASGQYGCVVPSGWSGSITPTLAGHTFTPASRSYTNVTANQATQNYTASAAAASALFFIHADHLNTPRLVSNQSGQTVWRWDQQEPFGNNPADENPSGMGTFDLPLRLPGQYLDKETNLHYNYFRDYDPSLGRYAESDPIGLRGGINTYAYVAGTPLSAIDKYGWKTFKICGAANGIKFPDNFGPFSFTQACINHDVCYDDCVNRPTREQCDKQFFDDTMNACNAIPLFFRILGAAQECVDLALKYSIAVQTFGQTAFNIARAKCSCQL